MNGTTVASNLAVMAVEQGLLGAMALFLHRWRGRYGLAPFLIFLAGLVTILHALGSAGVFVHVGSSMVEVSSATVVPVLAMSVLVLYIVDGTAPARVTILGVVGLSSLILLIQVGRFVHLTIGATTVPSLGSDNGFLGRSWEVTVASTFSLVLTLATVALAYQTLTNRARALPRWAAIGLALLAAMALDDAVFRTILMGWGGLVTSWPAGMSGKVLATLVLWPMASAHVRAMERTGTANTAGTARPTLDVLFGSYQERDQALRREEEQRRRTEEQLSVIASHAPLVLFAVNREGIFTASQGAGLRALGLTPGEVVGQSAYGLYPEAEDQIRAALQGETVTRLLREGDLAFSITYSPIREGDEITGISGVAVDITERLAAERALRTSEIRFRSTFEQAAVGLVHADPGGRITLANGALRTMVRAGDRDLMDTQLVELVHPEERDEASDGLRNLLSGATDLYTSDVRFLCQGGGWVWIHLTLSLVRNDSGAPLFFIAVAEDLTERRATEEQLRHAQKIEAMGQLTGGVAHDFNNLLTVIIGGLDLAIHDQMGEAEVQEILREVHQAADKGAALTQRLLAFSRRQTLQPVSLDVSELLANMQKLLARTLGEAVELEVTVSPDVGTCVADRAQMESAILNLALNARDAMDGRGHLRIRAERVTPPRSALPSDAAPGTYIRVSVQDEGEGIATEHLDRVFEPFFTTKGVGKGSGLGLSMVYGFAQQSNGFVRLSSEIGRGTTVELHLPAGEARGAEPAAVPTGIPRGAGEHVLLVEDQPDVRSMLLRMLSELGYRVTPVDRAAPALEILRDGVALDLLLTDVVLPDGVSGLDIAQDAARLRPELPVVFATGYAGASLPGAQRGEAPARVIQKPFRKADLARILRSALDEAAS